MPSRNRDRWATARQGRPVPLLLAAAMLAAFLVTFAFRWLTISDFDNDHFDHVARAYQVLLGEWPVRDFVDPGLPLMYLLSAAVHSVVPGPFLAEALIFVPAFAIAAALSLRLAWIASGSILLASGAVLVQLASYPRSYSYPKLLVYALALTVGWWAVDRLTRARLAVLAGVTALAYYFRHDHGLYVGVAALVLLTVHTLPQGIRRVGTAATGYAALVLLFVLPHLIYVQSSSGVVAYLTMLRDYGREEARKDWLTLPSFRIDPSRDLWGGPEPPLVYVRWLPGVEEAQRAELERRYGLRPLEQREGSTWRYEVLDLSSANLRRLRGDSAVEDTHDFDRLAPATRWRQAFGASLQPGPGLLVVDNSAALLFWLAWLAPCLGALAVAFRSAAPRTMTNAAPKIAMLVAVAVCLNIGFIRNPLAARLPDIAVPQSILWAWLLATAWRARPASVPRALVRTALVAGAAVAIAAIGWLFEPLEHVRRTGVGGGVREVAERWGHVSRELRQDLGGPLPNGPARALLPFFQYVRRCTARDDRLLVADYAPEAYVLARRGFAGGHLMFLGRFHASPAEQALTIDRLRRQRVPFVIIPSGREDDFRQVFAAVWTDLAPRYLRMTSIPLEGGAHLEVLVERSRLAGGLAADPAGWPCPL